jgi:hypothetical protein
MHVRTYRYSQDLEHEVPTTYDGQSPETLWLLLGGSCLPVRVRTYNMIYATGTRTVGTIPTNGYYFLLLGPK